VQIWAGMEAQQAGSTCWAEQQAWCVGPEARRRGRWRGEGADLWAHGDRRQTLESGGGALTIHGGRARFVGGRTSVGDAQRGEASLNSGRQATVGRRRELARSRLEERSCTRRRSRARSFGWRLDLATTTTGRFREVARVQESTERREVQGDGWRWPAQPVAGPRVRRALGLG
jgi:hypothetical protein